MAREEREGTHPYSYSFIRFASRQNGKKNNNKPQLRKLGGLVSLPKNLREARKRRSLQERSSQTAVSSCKLHTNTTEKARPRNTHRRPVRVATSFVERASFIYCSFDSAPEIQGVGVRGCSGYAIILCAFLQDGVWAILGGTGGTC